VFVVILSSDTALSGFPVFLFRLEFAGRLLPCSDEFGGGWSAANLGEFLLQLLSGSFPTELDWWFVTKVVVAA
jgi:hypothetical protein